MSESEIEKKIEEIKKLLIKALIEAFKEEKEINLDDDGTTFNDIIKEAFESKSIVMADTMTLMKYEECMNTICKKGIESICMCDEADCEFLDAAPYEVLGSEYSEETQKNRFEIRKKADEQIVNQMDNIRKGKISLKDISEENSIPLDFLVDAYEVRSSFTKEGEEYVIGEGGKITTINPAKRVLEQATQGHEQAIYAMRANERERAGAGEGEGKDEIPIEREVLDVKYPYQVIGKYLNQSLISGTLEDRGLSQFKEEGDGLYEAFSVARTSLFKGMGFRTPATIEVINFKTVGPLTRVNKGMVMSVTKDSPLQVDEEKGDELQPVESFSLGDESWKSYIGNNRGELEKQWKEEVKAEIERRKKEKPVLVSVLNEDIGKDIGKDIEKDIGEISVYTDANKPSDNMKYGGKMFLRKGKAYFMDDAYGRGYNSKFEGKDGHVLITSLPINSRNLEQFLYRVARGGDEGSSSMIISPTDPKLIEFLENMDKQLNDEKLDDEKLDQYLKQYKNLFNEGEWTKLGEERYKGLSSAYFEKLMQGKISIDRLIFDIYPEETIRVMSEMTNKNDYSKRTQSQINDIMDTLKTAGEEGNLDKNIIKYMEKALKKSRAKHIKTHDGENIDTDMDKIQQEAAISVMLTLAKSKKKLMSQEEFQTLMPEGQDTKTIERIYELVKNRIKTQGKIKTQRKEGDNKEQENASNDRVTTSTEGNQIDPIEEAIIDYDIDTEDVLKAVNDVKEFNDVKELNQSKEVSRGIDD